VTIVLFVVDRGAVASAAKVTRFAITAKMTRCNVSAVRRGKLAPTLTAVAVAFTWACGTDQSQGLVSAATPEAASAGARILAAGGNAVDAAVAVSFALAVTEPAMSGLGGQTQLLVAAPNLAPLIINGTSFAPVGTPEGASAEDIERHTATTVPSMVRTLEHAWRMLGSGRIEWAQLIAPAIEYAENGFVVGPFRHRVWRQLTDDLRADPTVAALFLDSEGMPPDSGSSFQQPILARTLRRIAEHGAADFYTGEIARTIAADMEANAGWLSYEDLAAFPRPNELTPLHGTYRGWDIHTMPPPGGGWVVLQILNVLELNPEDELAFESPNRLAHVIDALRIGHRQRRDHPVENLLDYDADVRRKTDKGTARTLTGLDTRPRGETTHFTVVDASGMVVSVTASINNFFGARVASPELGFLYNDYMNEFVYDDPDHPFALHPGAMPYSSMTPTILSRDGRPVAGLGSPGSARIVSTTAQVIQLWVDTDLGIAGAVAAGRSHVVPDSLLFLEASLPHDQREDLLQNRGFVLGEPRAYLAVGDLNAYFGGVHAVAFEDGAWHGAADPRRDGAVVRP
jgi:gamma-glutamyltranspeptidase/glutathione hydrolase